MRHNICLTLSTPGKNISRRHFEIFFLFSPKKNRFDVSPFETIRMKCQILFSEKKNYKNNIIKLSSAELAQGVVNVK